MSAVRKVSEPSVENAHPTIVCKLLRLRTASEQFLLNVLVFPIHKAIAKSI